MSIPTLLIEPGHVDEPQQAQDYANVLSQVASNRRPVIVRREGTDLAAVIPLEYLELVREVFATQEAEKLAAEMDWPRLIKTCPPPQEWFDGDEAKPF